MTAVHPQSFLAAQDTQAAVEFDGVIWSLRDWLKARDFAGYEPYDLLNSPYLKRWAHHQPFATLFIQAGKRYGGLGLRRILAVPASRNPKAIGLALAAYCDLARCGWDCYDEAADCKQHLRALRSRGAQEWCWGYDWHYVSLRGARLAAHAPNSIATVFCAEALLDHAEMGDDPESRDMAISAAHWAVTRLQRSVDGERHLCLSYTPWDRTRIFNNNALIGGLLGRVAQYPGQEAFFGTARKIMKFLADGQAADGSWPYGLSRAQGWIDSFHTGYNLCALLEYQRATGDYEFVPTLLRGYDFYREHFFRSDGAPRYFHDRTYPIDIHACSQAIITFCEFNNLDPGGLGRAVATARWAIAHLRNRDGSFGYQVHRWRKDMTPYMRWSQAWMFRALARLRVELQGTVREP